MDNNSSQTKIPWSIKILWIFTGLFSLGQLQRIEISPNVAFYLHDVFITGWLFFVLFFKPHFYRKISRTFLNYLKKNHWLKLVSVVLIISEITTVKFCLTNQTITPLLYLSRLFAYLIFALNVKFELNNSKIKKNYLQSQYFFAGGLIAVLGLFQFIFLPDVRFLFLYGWDDHFYRLISTLFDPAFTGLVLLIALIFSLKTKNSRKIIYALRLLFLLAIILTFSRATYLAGILAFIYFGVNKLKFDKYLLKKSVIIIILVILSSGFLQYVKGGEGTNLFRTSTILARFENSLEIIQNMNLPSLLIGGGWFTNLNQNLKIQDHSKVPDNLIIMLVSTLGIPGFIVLLAGICEIAKKSLKLSPVFFSILIAIIIHAQFNNALFQPFIWLYFWWGISVFEEINFKA